MNAKIEFSAGAEEDLFQLIFKSFLHLWYKNKWFVKVVEALSTKVNDFKYFVVDNRFNMRNYNIINTVENRCINLMPT